MTSALLINNKALPYERNWLLLIDIERGERGTTMGILSFLFGSQEDEPQAVDIQPAVNYPDWDPTEEDVDLSKLCRACSNGAGDGICSYHAHQMRMSLKRLEIRDR